jgi:hypothetical protein
MNPLNTISTIINTFKESPNGQKKVPFTSQKAGDFFTSKTNLTGSPLVTYGLYLLASDPSNGIGHAYLIGGVALIAIKDAIVKTKKP